MRSSVETITRSEEGQWVEWTAESTDKYYIIGLSHQDTDVGCNSIECGVSLFDDGMCHIRASDFLDCAAGGRFKVVVTGDAVTYERNDEMFYTSTKKPNRRELRHTRYKGNEREAHRSINNDSSPSACLEVPSCTSTAGRWIRSEQDGLSEQKAGGLRPSVFSACASRPHL
jgi:hypothetical protein